LTGRGTEINLKSALDMDYFRSGGKIYLFMTQRWPCPDWMMGNKDGTEINSNSALNMSHCTVQFAASYKRAMYYFRSDWKTF
jgi:hypothetical protein